MQIDATTLPKIEKKGIKRSEYAQGDQRTICV